MHNKLIHCYVLIAVKLSEDPFQFYMHVVLFLVIFQARTDILPFILHHHIHVYSLTCYVFTPCFYWFPACDPCYYTYS